MVYVWVDGWMDGIEADGWIDRCMDGFTHFFTKQESLETLGQEIAFLSSQLNIYQKSSSQLPR